MKALAELACRSKRSLPRSSQWSNWVVGVPGQTCCTKQDQLPESQSIEEHSVVQDPLCGSQATVNKINSSIKSWLYADQFLKPEELVMFGQLLMLVWGSIMLSLKLWLLSQEHFWKLPAFQSFEKAFSIQICIDTTFSKTNPSQTQAFLFFTPTNSSRRSKKSTEKILSI